MNIKPFATVGVWILQCTALACGGVLAYGLATSNTALSGGAYVALVLALAASTAAMLLARDGGLALYVHRAFFQNAWTTTLVHLIFLRFQILTTVFLILSPWVAMTMLARFAKNLYVVTLLDLFFIAWLATSAAWSIMASTVLTVRYGPMRFHVAGMKMQPWLRRFADRGRLALFAVLAAPQFLTAWAMLPRGDKAMGMLSIVCGVGAAWSALCLATILREWLAPSSVVPSMHMPRDDADRVAQSRRRRFPWKMTWLHRTLGEGYFDPETAQPWAGHMHAASLLMVSTLVYLLFGYMFAPNSSLHEYFPSLAYVLLVLILAAWALPALAFFFDRWRLPTLLTVLVLTLILHTIAPTSNVYLIQPVEALAETAAGGAAETEGDATAVREGATEASDRPIAAAEAYARWSAARQQPNRAVIVLATGGGITAAAWTATVLTGLEQWLGEDFTNALTAISSVSGGSVGAMYYLDDFEAGLQRDQSVLDRIRAASAANSLRATAWGIAYSDLWRFTAPPLVRALPEDRGWAMQANWASRMVHGDATLRQWAHRVNQGLQPVSIMSATTVETGEPFLFAPVQLSRGSRPRVHSFFHNFPDHDLPIATSARLSATFPWVSPIAAPALSRWGSPELRTADGERPFHLADGAYFDNYGVLGADHWLEDILRSRSQPMQVLVIRINAWDADADEEPDDPVEDNASQNPTTEDNATPLDERALNRPVTEMKRDEWLRTSGWVHATYGPIKTMLNVRLASQMAQDKRIRNYWESRVQVTDASFNLRVRAPMSWKLPARIVERIERAWRNELNAAETDSPVARVRDFVSTAEQ